MKPWWRGPGSLQPPQLPPHPTCLPPHEGPSPPDTLGTSFLSFFFAVLGLELRAFTLSHSTSPIFVKRFSR
jgi:hypothetical protein